jgi:uncharacterized membrane protein
MKSNHRIHMFLRINFIAVIILFVVECTIPLFALSAALSTIECKTLALLILYFATFALAAGSCIAVLYCGRKENVARSRLYARIAIGALIFNSLITMATFGLGWESLAFLYQIAVLIGFQVYTDQHLSHPIKFTNPFKSEIKAGQARRERKASHAAENDEHRAEAKDTYLERASKELTDYIPLNFFNIFWIFVVCSVLGLIIEVLFHAVVFGGYEDRAGLLWGPFSPIYGFGAVLMTIALNRFWDQSKLIIFVIAGLIGAAFEFFVSFFLEYSFGIIAWDYSGTFLNIAGRTNFVFFCVWGFLGLVWIKMLLPDVLKIIDVIPLKWRSAITIAFASLMILDGAMTLVTLDCWYQRQADLPISSPLQTFCAQRFDDTFMAERFQSMSIDPTLTTRIS